MDKDNLLTTIHGTTQSQLKDLKSLISALTEKNIFSFDDINEQLVSVIGNEATSDINVSVNAEDAIVLNLIRNEILESKKKNFFSKYKKEIIIKIKVRSFILYLIT